MVPLIAGPGLATTFDVWHVQIGIVMALVYSSLLEKVTAPAAARKMKEKSR
jgi:hypothetical protein